MVESAIYQKISRAARDLKDAEKITERRSAASRLKELITNRSNRLQLLENAERASFEDEDASYRLSVFYSSILETALFATGATMSGKSKCEAQDYTFPFILLSSIDQESDVKLSAKYNEQQEQLDQCAPFTFDSLNRYQQTNATLTYASSEVFGKLLRHCLDCFDNEDIMAESPSIQTEMMKHLAKLCSRADYVANFNTNKDVASVIEIVDYLLSENTKRSNKKFSVGYACLAFHDLFQNLITRLGIDVSNHISPCFQVIINWIRNCKRVEDNSVHTGKMFATAATIMTAHPEQCCTVLGEDDLGHILFQYATKGWESNRDYSRLRDREQLLSFFSAYIYVSEIAGNYQGLLPGDLGLIGDKSTLDETKLESMKDMLLCPSKMDSLFKMTDTEETSGRNSKQRRTTRIQDQFRPLPKIVRKYLELSARLLRCLQRLHLIKLERESVEDISAYLQRKNSESYCENTVPHQSSTPDGSFSPFMSLITLPCFSGLASNKAKSNSSLEWSLSSSPLDNTFSVQSLSQSSDIGNGFNSSFQIENFICENAEISDSEVVVYLQIIAACSEAFPRGECWSSSNSWYHTDYSPFECDEKNSLHVRQAYCNVCAIGDVAQIVYLLSLLLDKYGHGNGNQQVQKWIFICLLKLTDSSHISTKYITFSKDDTDKICNAWRAVWNSILRTELRYQASTSNPTPGSVGEFVLMLLTEIIKGDLMSFGSIHFQNLSRDDQINIWSLPLFSDGSKVLSSVPLELVSAILSCSDISGIDSRSICGDVMDPSVQKMFTSEAEYGRGIHFRLAYYGIQALYFNSKHNEAGLRKIGPSLSQYFASLVNAKPISLTTYGIQGLSELKVTCATSHSSLFLDSLNETNLFVDDSRHYNLWNDTIFPFHAQFEIENNPFMWSNLDGLSYSCPQYSLLDRLWLQECRKRIVQRKVPTYAKQTISDIGKYCMKHLVSLLLPEDLDKSPNKNEKRIKSKSSLSDLIVAKVALSIAFTDSNPAVYMEDSMKSLEAVCRSVSSQVISGLQGALDEEFTYNALEFIGVVKFIRYLFESGLEMDITFDIFPENVIDTWKDILWKAGTNHFRKRNSHTPVSSQKKCKSRGFDSEDSEDEGQFSDDNIPYSTSNRKRKRKEAMFSKKHSTSPAKSSEGSNAYSQRLHFWIIATISSIFEPSSSNSSALLKTLSDSATRDPHDFLLYIATSSTIFLPKNNTFHDNKCDFQRIGIILDNIASALKRMRELATAPLPMHLCGFGVSELLLIWKCSDYDKVRAILRPSGSRNLRSLKCRPQIKCLQIRSAKKCFLVGSSEFHLEFDSEFAKDYLVESLKNQNPRVRKAGIEALGSALHIFPAERHMTISSDVLRKFPPKPVIDDELFQSRQIKESASFSKWLESNLKTVEFKDEKRRSWYETRFAVECDKLFALGTICMYTTDISTRRAATFALLLLSRSEKRQLATSSILERISSHKGYSNVEVFLLEEEMYFLDFWMKIKRDSLEHLPIAFTSPSVLRDIARLNLCDTFSVYRKYGSQEDEEDSLCKCTAKSYISQNMNTIVSQVITSHLSNLQDSTELFEDSEDSKEILEDNLTRFYLREVADECTDGVIKVLIEKCFPIVYVRLLPLLASTNKHLSVGSAKVMNNLRSILPHMDDQIRNKSQILLRESISLDAKSLLDPYKDDYLDSCFSSSIVHISKVISSSKKNKNAQPQALSINSIEAILQLRHLLENSQSFSLKSSVWKTMEFIMSFIQENTNDTVGFEFCIRSLLALGHHEKDDFLFNVVMDTFLSLLDKWIANYSHGETFLDTMSVLASTLQLYEYFQSKILQSAEKNTQNFLSYHRHAKPLGSIEDNTHIPEKPYNSFRYAINHDIAQNISLLHDIISKLFHFRKRNGHKNLSLVQGIDPISSKVLQKLDSKFTLDSVMQVNDELSSGLDLNSVVDYYIEASTTFIQSAKSGNISPRRSARLDPEERSFLRSLDRLNTTLDDLIQNGNQLENSMIKKLAQLQHVMVKICNEKVHSDIQVIASKLSGDIGIFCLSGNCGGIALEESCTISDPDEVLHSIFISAIGLLSKRIESINITEANFAKDTLKLIALTRDGQDCKKSKDLPSKSAHLLQSFGDKSAHYGSNVSLPVATLQSLYSLAEVMTEEAKDDLSWCWNDNLWKICPRNHCFPTWVKNIVSSIIICCYDTKCYFRKSSSSTRPLRGESDFFGACLLMTSMDHELAATLFHGVVYDILSTDLDDSISKDKESRKNTMHPRHYMCGQAASLANQRLTQCFQNTLTDFISLSKTSATITPDIQYTVQLILTTIDKLRTITENKFHKQKLARCYGTVPKFNKKGGSGDEMYAKIKPAPSWLGRPYGTVLNFSGLEIAEAFACCKDYTRALYYAEFFADNRLGSSGNTFETTHTYKGKINDISGFGSLQKPDTTADHDNQTTALISLEKILHQCFIGLQEEISLKALSIQTSSLRFKHPDKLSSHHVATTSSNLSSSILHELMDIDSIMQYKRLTGSIIDNLAVSRGLNQLGLRELSRKYLGGVCASDEIQSQKEFQILEDEWAEQFWRSYQMNPCLLAANQDMSALLKQIEPFKLPAPTFEKKDSSSVPSYNVSLLKSIQALANGDVTHFSNCILDSRVSIVDNLHRNNGSYIPDIELSSFTLKSSTINQLEELGSVILQGSSQDNWLKKYCNTSRHFSTDMSGNELERYMAAHEIFLKFLHSNSSTSDEVGTCISDHLLSMCDTFRRANQSSVALSALNRLKEFSQIIDSETKKISVLRLSFEEAKIQQNFGNTASAVAVCKEIIDYINALASPSVEEKVLLIETQSQISSWSIEYSVDSKVNVLNFFLKPAAQSAWKLHQRKEIDSKIMSKTNFECANFAANLYDDVLARLESHEWKMICIAAKSREDRKSQLEAFLDRKRKEYEACKSTKEKQQSTKEKQQSTKEKQQIVLEYNLMNKELHKVEIEISHDKKEKNDLVSSADNYLKVAIQQYGMALTSASASGDCYKHVFRLLSLWFQNSDDDIEEIICEWLAQLSTHYFVPLVYQIFSRVDSTDNAFQTTLRNLVTKICIDHPYHSLMQLCALANGDKVQAKRLVNTDKVAAVKKIIERIHVQGNTFTSNLLDSYVLLSTAYHEFAMYPTEEWVDKGLTKDIKMSHCRKISQNLLLDRCLKDRKLQMPCIVTKNPNLNCDSEYECDPVGSELIKAFEPKFSVTDSGIHRPKIIICLGTKGGKYKQLVKGDDDIRQDAVMQQVFATVNTIFSNQSKKSTSSNRNLHICTYSCVPMSPRSGVLEWVMDTMPISPFITGPKNGKEGGADNKYYPGEWKNSDCINFLKHAPAPKSKALTTIYEHYSPVFRFFFLEKFSHSPYLWHAARKAYTRSCAVNSFVGNVLGIGDRHLFNILIKETTGELVHIDFGIVFEQGKLLPIPERVPFRLTRNLIDGMGPLGVEGTFTSAALATTETLRNNASALITVLSAVVSDPLYSWDMSAEKGRKVQQTSSGYDDEASSQNGFANDVIVADPDNSKQNRGRDNAIAASRVIARINQKLQGYEDGNFGEQHTVEGQVRFLVNQATNVENLSLHFPGWGSWI